MRIRRELVAAAAFLSCSLGAVFAVEKDAASSKPLPIAHVHFEQNATDGDVEVVIKVKGGDDGLAKLTVVSPDGRTVLDFKAPDDSTLGTLPCLEGFSCRIRNMPWASAP